MIIPTHMKPFISLILTLAVPAVSLAEQDIPLLMPEERQAVDSQAAEFSDAIAPALTSAAKSTVRVWSGSRRVAYGTVVGDGTKIISKWSEVARGSGNLRVDVSGSEYRDVKLSGVYEDEDIVVLDVEGKSLTPIDWTFEAPKLGSFLAAPQPDGKPAAYGVVSVLERNLRDTDLAFLGVIADPGYHGQGVRISQIDPGSGAFAAGLKPGAVILKVGDRSISGLTELQNALVGIAPGTTVPVLVEAKGSAQTVQVLLGNRPKMAQFGGERLETMERMGGAISQVRTSFTHAIQTDMRPKPNQIGGPVVNLKGQAVGITIARADRTRAFVMPATAVVNLLKKEAANPALAQVRNEETEAPMQARGPTPQRRMMPGGEERMRRHLGDMQRLMDHLREEMDGIEDP
jgi:serine protease Do